MSGHFNDDSFVDYVEDEQRRKQRRVNVEGLYTERFVPDDLEGSLRKAGIQQPDVAAEICRDKSLEMHPHNKDKAEKMSFVVSFSLNEIGHGEDAESVFHKLNSALNEGNLVDLKSISSLLFGFLKSLRSLPYMQYDVLYRGLSVNVKWKKEDVKEWSAFTSMSTIREEAEKFLGRDGCGTLIRGKGLFGYCIKGYSFFNDENEVILEPFQVVYVESISEVGGISEVDVVDVGNTKPILTDSKNIPANVLIPLPTPIKNSESGYLLEALGHYCCGLNDEIEGKEDDAERHYKSAFELTERACDDGNQISLMNLGNCYFFGIGVDKDEERAYSYWERAGSISEHDVEPFSVLSNLQFTYKERRLLMCLFSFLLSPFIII